MNTVVTNLKVVIKPNYDATVATCNLYSNLTVYSLILLKTREFGSDSSSYDDD